MTGKVRPVHIVAQIKPLLQLDLERLARIIDQVGKVNFQFLR